MYFIVSFVFCLHSFLSFLSALFLLYVFVYLHTLFLSIQLLFLCFVIHFFFIPFFLFSLLTSSPHSIRLYSCLVLFFSACVSHFHSIKLRRMLAHVVTFLFVFGRCSVRISAKTLSGRRKTRQSSGLSTMQTTVLSDVTRCSLLDTYRRFR